MLTNLNNFLSPIENHVKNYRKWIGYFLLFLACLAPLYFLEGLRGTKESGEKAIFVLWIILWMPILARVFGLRLFAQMLPLRKELGILMGVLALVHGFSFMIPNQEYLNSGTAFWMDGKPTFLLFGIVAMWLSVPLTLTSSTWAMRKLGRYWKKLHRLVYIILFLAIVHVVLLKGDIAPIVVLGLYFVFKVLEWKGISLAKSYSKS